MDEDPLKYFLDASKCEVDFIQGNHERADNFNKLTSLFYQKQLSLHKGVSATTDADLPEIFIEGLAEDTIWEQVQIVNRNNGEKLVCVSTLDDEDFLQNLENDSSDEEGLDEIEDDGEEEEVSEDEEEEREADVERKTPEKDQFFDPVEMEKFLNQQEDSDQMDEEDDQIDYFDSLGSDDDEEQGIPDGSDSEMSDISFPDEDDKEAIESSKNLMYDDYYVAKDKKKDVKEEDEEEEEVSEDQEETSTDPVASDKPWQMMGETKSDNRPLNSLLEETLNFEHVSRNAPEITDEHTFNLEAVIKRRILDGAFSNVKRKIKEVKDPINFKRKVLLDSEKSKLSLNEIYEKEYLAKVNQDKEEKENPDHVKITSMMTSLFHKLDVLSHNHFKQAVPDPEIKIIKNVPAVTLEDVQPITHSTSEVLAPEEILEKKELIGKDEKTKEDRNRERRKKKIKQKARSKHRQQKLESLAETNEKMKGLHAMKQLEKASKAPGSKTTIIKGTSKSAKLTSSKSFFSKLDNQQAKLL